MQSKRDGLIPVAEVLSDLGGQVQAIRDTSPQALHHFTQADQVNQLVGASEADPDRGLTLPSHGESGKISRDGRSQLLRVFDSECQVDDPIDLALLRRTWLALDLERNRWIGRGNRHEGEK